MRIVSIVGLVVTAMAAPVAAQTLSASAPAIVPPGTPMTASGPASAPGETRPDPSTPNAAVISFYTASRDGDAKAMAATLAIDEPLKALVPPLLDLSAASVRYHAALEKQFGAAAIARAKIETPMSTAALLKEASEATPVIDGDHATLTLRGLAGGVQKIELKRVKDQWRIDAASTLHLANAEQVAKATKLLPVITASTRAMDEARAEIAAGKHGTPTAAQHSLEEKLLLAAKAGE